MNSRTRKLAMIIFILIGLTLVVRRALAAKFRHYPCSAIATTSH